MGSLAVDFKGKVNGSWVCEFSVKQVGFQFLVGLSFCDLPIKIENNSQTVKRVYFIIKLYIQISFQNKL